MAKSSWISKALEEFEAPLLRYALSIVGDLERARDIVQDTFLRLCKQQPEAVDDHLAPWLFRVCRNRALDSQRRQGRMNAIEQNQLTLVEDPAASPLESLETRENLARLETLLCGIPERQRELLRLKFQNGLSYKEISTVTGLSTSNIGFLIHTAIKALRQQVRNENVNPKQIRRIK